MLEIGSVVDGKYKILNKIGQGGMSVVYLAINEAANKPWAIKEVRKDGTKDFEVVRQGLIVETDMLKRLNHPNLPSIIDVIDQDDTFLIVMDYIEGRSLSDVLKENGAQPQEYVIEWAKQLCDVLGYLHSRKPPIIYRDMKPANVMLKPDGNVTLIDFGTAREFKNRAMVEDTTCLGTQGYAAPEQFGGHGQTDARTDIYCLGATIYHLVTGHNPAKPPYEMYPIRQWNQHLSSGLEQIILKCINKDPEKRYQSCSELMYALDHFEEMDYEYRRGHKRRLFAFGATLALSLGLFVTAGFMSGKESDYQSQNYERYYEAADTAANEKEFRSNIEAALALNATDAKAYDLILEKYESNFVDENGTAGLSHSEFAKIKNMVDSAGDSKLEKLREADPMGYYRFCYRLGLDIWAMDSSGGYSKPWLERVEKYTDGNTNNDKEYETAQLLLKVNDYITKIGNNNQLESLDGDSIQYGAFWDDLKALYNTATDSDAMSTPATQLLTYNKILDIIEERCKEFYGSRENKSDLYDLVNDIEAQWKSGRYDPTNNSYSKLYEMVGTKIGSARKKIDSVATVSKEEE